MLDWHGSCEAGGNPLKEFDMTTATAPATTEWKNLLGVCACLGEDFGFNPLWLRIAFAVALLWNPTAVIVAYVTLGLIVLASRLIAPNRRAANG